MNIGTKLGLKYKRSACHDMSTDPHGIVVFALGLRRNPLFGDLGTNQGKFFERPRPIGGAGDITGQYQPGAADRRRANINARLATRGRSDE